MFLFLLSRSFLKWLLMWCRTSTTSWATDPTVRRTTALRPGWWTTSLSTGIYLNILQPWTHWLEGHVHGPISFFLLWGCVQLQTTSAWPDSLATSRLHTVPLCLRLLLQSARPLSSQVQSSLSQEELQLFTQLSRFKLSALNRGVDDSAAACRNIDRKLCRALCSACKFIITDMASEEYFCIFK